MVDAIKRIFTMRNVFIAQAIISGVGFIFLCAVLAFDKTLTPNATWLALQLAGIHGLGAVVCGLLAFDATRRRWE